MPAGTQVWERTTIVPKHRLGNKPPFHVAAESTDLAPGVTPEEWNTRVLARFSADDLASMAHEQDSFLGGRPATRSVVKLKAPVGPARVTWGCWWTGIVDGRGLAIAVESFSPVSLEKASRYRDLFVLGAMLIPSLSGSSRNAPSWHAEPAIRRFPRDLPRSGRGCSQWRGRSWLWSAPPRPARVH